MEPYSAPAYSGRFDTLIVFRVSRYTGSTAGQPVPEYFGRSKLCQCPTFNAGHIKT